MSLKIKGMSIDEADSWRPNDSEKLKNKEKKMKKLEKSVANKDEAEDEDWGEAE